MKINEQLVQFIYLLIYGVVNYNFYELCRFGHWLGDFNELSTEIYKSCFIIFELIRGHAFKITFLVDSVL